MPEDLSVEGLIDLNSVMTFILFLCMLANLKCAYTNLHFFRFENKGKHQEQYFLFCSMNT